MSEALTVLASGLVFAGLILVGIGAGVVVASALFWLTQKVQKWLGL